MAKIHINGEGNPGKCSAEPGNCPFGSPDEHYASFQAARAAYEVSQASTGWRITKQYLLEQLIVSPGKSSHDYFEINLGDADRILSTLHIRILSGKRMWPQWRENYYDPELPNPPKGIHDELQRRVFKLLPGWSLVSNEYELSDSGKDFRTHFMERNEGTPWEFDNTLEGDAGVEDATPRLSLDEARELLADTPLSRLFTPSV